MSHIPEEKNREQFQTEGQTGGSTGSNSRSTTGQHTRAEGEQNATWLENPVYEIDAEFLLEQVKAIIKQPVETFDRLSEDSFEPRDLLRKILIPFAILNGICAFLGMAFFGIPTPFGGITLGFFPSLLHGMMTSLQLIISALLVALVVEKVVTQGFEGKTNFRMSLNLVIFSIFPALVLGVLQLFPALTLVSAVLSCYGLYLYYLGLPKLAIIPEDKQLICFVTTMVIAALACMITSMVLFYFIPYPDLSVPGEAAKYLEGLQNLGQGLKGK